MSLPGPKLSLSYAADSRNVIATMAYRPDGLQPAKTPIRDIQLRNLSCPNIRGVRMLGQRLSFLCTRDDPYSESEMILNLQILNSPPSIVVPPVEKPLEPKYDIAGEQKLADGTVYFRQKGTRVGWSYQNESFTHEMTGLYYSDTEFIGSQTRVNRKNGCKVIMKITGYVSQNKGFEHNGSISDNSPSTCDLPQDYTENIHHTY
jgi:hypothetical protein